MGRKNPRSAIGYRTDIPGFAVRRTSKGITVVEIDYWADRRKDETWAEKMKRGMPSLVHWRREFGRDWSSAAGESFYPEFVARPEFYIRRCPSLIEAPVIRGWDFGFRHPACVWLQHSPVTGRVWVIREIMPGGFTNESGRIDTGSFADLVLYLSGQIPFEAIAGNQRALQVVNDINATEGMPKAPWFGGDGTASPLRFLDWAGHEASITSSTPDRDSKDRTHAAILLSKGIPLAGYYTTPKARENAIRQLLKAMPDGLPGIFFDPACRLLIDGFGGGIAYPKPTKENQDPTDPQKDGWFEHTHEALGYPLAQIIHLGDTGALEIPVHMIPQGRGYVAVRSDGFDLKEMDGTW